MTFFWSFLYDEFNLICCSVIQSCLTVCDPADCSTPGLPVLHRLRELAQTQVHRVSDAVHPSHPLPPLLLLPSILPAIWVFSSESALFCWMNTTYMMSRYYWEETWGVCGFITVLMRLCWVASACPSLQPYGLSPPGSSARGIL